MIKKLLNLLDKYIIGNLPHKCKCCGKPFNSNISQRGDWFICSECLKKDSNDGNKRY